MDDFFIHFNIYAFFTKYTVLTLAILAMLAFFDKTFQTTKEITKSTEL